MQLTVETVEKDLEALKAAKDRMLYLNEVLLESNHLASMINMSQGGDPDVYYAFVAKLHTLLMKVIGTQGDAVKVIEKRIYALEYYLGTKQGKSEFEAEFDPKD